MRFHGLLDDDFSISLGPNQTSYINLDSLIDFTQSIGVAPLFEVSFMPSWLAANASQTIMHYRGITSPPSNYTQWGLLVEDMARHLLERYGPEAVSSWLFEIWNEPNGGFWTGNPKQQTYFQLYKEAADAFRRVSPLFRVGGPAMAGCPGWISDLRTFANSTNTTLSFVSCHTYGGGDQPDNVGSIHDFAGALPSTRKAAGNLPVVITEWSRFFFFLVVCFWLVCGVGGGGGGGREEGEEDRECRSKTKEEKGELKQKGE